MITGSIEGLAAFGECGIEFVGTFQSRAQHRSAEAVKVAAGGVDDEQTLRGEDCCVELGEGLGKGAAGLVGSG